MVSVKYLYKLLERFGIVNFNRFKSARRNAVQSVHVSLNNSLFVLFATSHSYSVVTRAKRYYPELVQTCFETIILWFFYYVVCFVRKNHRKIYSLSEYFAWSTSPGQTRK
uniref:Uncharacterized protein n=1 Tax=Cacopsylla melanoneura TaxID=428564 RepID=A0A8D8QCN3_9HEMI